MSAHRSEAVQGAADRLRAALDTLPLGVVVTDESGEVVFRNRGARNLADPRTADVLLATAVADLLAVAGHGVPKIRTLELRGPPPRTLVVSAQPLSGGGRALGTVAVISDVSERRQLDAVRRDFVANVSHELRTPVGAMGLLAETLAGEEDTTVARHLAARISAEAERVARIIDDLLDLSRIEVGGLTRRTVVALHDVVSTAAERVAPVADRHGVELRLPGPAPGPAVVGEEGQLVSAVANLLDNAVKYSEAASAVEVELRGAGGWAEVVVRDHGIGIPGRDLERVFERFYRVDRARSRATGGTGLGLAIVRHVATNHGGEVTVESCEGEGSTFTLRLPECEP